MTRRATTPPRPPLTHPCGNCGRMIQSRNAFCAACNAKLYGEAITRTRDGKERKD